MIDNPCVGNSPSETRPFVFELRRLEEQPNGQFRPGASLKVTPILRTSGLLLQIPGEDLKNLLFLLTFLHPNGRCTPSLHELAEAMRVSRIKVRQRMRRLAQIRWQGEPLVFEVKRESGLEAFAPSPHLIAAQEEPPATPAEPRPGPSSRERVIAHTREHHARPRAEVEATIAKNMGWDEDPDDPRVSLRRQLENKGVSRDQADYLTANFDLEAVERQLEWLPYRKAKNPAAFLVAAIEGNYDAPRAVRGDEYADAGPDPSPIQEVHE